MHFSPLRPPAETTPPDSLLLTSGRPGLSHPLAPSTSRKLDYATLRVIATFVADGSDRRGKTCLRSSHTNRPSEPVSRRALLRDVSPPPFPTSPDSIHPLTGRHLASYHRCCLNNGSKLTPFRTPSVRPFAVEPTPPVQVYFHTYAAPPICVAGRRPRTAQTGTEDSTSCSSSSDSPPSPRSSAASDPPPSPPSIAATHVPYAPQAASDSLVPFAVSQHTHKMGHKTGYISLLRVYYNRCPTACLTPRWRAYSLICVLYIRPLIS